jgi:hypothetical protein
VACLRRRTPKDKDRQTLACEPGCLREICETTADGPGERKLPDIAYALIRRQSPQSGDFHSLFYRAQSRLLVTRAFMFFANGEEFLKRFAIRLNIAAFACKVQKKSSERNIAAFLPRVSKLTFCGQNPTLTA